MKTVTVQLGEVCEFVRGITFPSGEGKPVPFDDSIACLTTSGVQEDVAWNSRRFVQRTRVGSTKQMLQAGDILISTANSKELVGKSCLVNRPPFPCTFGAFVTVARPQASLYPPYLAYWMTTRKYLAWCFKQSSNTTNISNLRVSELEELGLPLPDLSVQQQIAGRLEQADRLRRTRRYTLELTDTFLPAAFLEIFGDPIQNAKGWPVVTVEEAGAVQLGRQRAPKYQTGRFRTPYIRVANVYENEIDLSSLLYMDFDASDCATYALQYGDILLNEGQSTELVGRSAMWRNEIPGCCFQNTLLRFQADRKMCEPAYALWLFLSYLHNGEFAKLSAKTSSVAHLGSYRLNQMRFPLPPLPLQKKFAALVERVARLHSVQREAVRQAKHLFASLLHSAFSDCPPSD